MKKSQDITEIAKALCVVQGNLKPAKKDSENPYFKQKYADLTSVWDSCRSLLNENGLSVCQTTTPTRDGKLLILDTTLLHTSGQWISGSTSIPLPKEDPQGLGSAMTYARRYGLSAIVGVCTEDDDAEAATPKQDTPKQEAPKKQPLSNAKEKLQEHCATLGWGQNEWKGYLSEKFGKEKLNQLTKEEQTTALANLEAMAGVKKATGENPELL